jgi:hypothetical protein
MIIGHWNNSGQWTMQIKGIMKIYLEPLKSADPHLGVWILESLLRVKSEHLVRYLLIYFHLHLKFRKKRLNHVDIDLKVTMVN